MSRIASVTLAVVIASSPGASMAQVVRTRASPVSPIGPSIGLPADRPPSLLVPGLPSGAPLLSSTIPDLRAPSVTPVSPVAAAPKADKATLKAVAVHAVASKPAAVRPSVAAALSAAKASPPEAASDAEAASASVLFDGVAVRSSPSIGDPVFPGEDPGTAVPRRPAARSRLSRAQSLPGAHAPLHVETGSPGGGHDHGRGHEHGRPEGRGHESALKRAMAAASFFIAVEMLGGFLTGNAALQADAIHLAADQVIIAAALFSAWLSRRPTSASRPGGSRKAESVVGLLAAALIGFTGMHMGVEAWERFFDPGAAPTWNVALFALASLGANLSSALILRRHHGSGLGVKGAFMVAITDTVGSIGVIVSAAASILYGWTWVEPLVVALIGLMIVRIAWGLAKPAWIALRASYSRR